MEARVVALEVDMKDVKAGIQRLEVSSARIESTMAGLATKADLAALTERVSAVDTRVGRVETSVGTALTIAVGKAIGPFQFVGMLAGAVAVLGGAVAGYAWMSHQPWFPH